MSISTENDRFTVYGCPCCGYASLSKGAFTAGRCIRCLSDVEPHELEVGPVDENRVLGALTSALHQAKAERDRSREALEAVVRLLDVVVVHDGRNVLNIMEAQRMAQRALGESNRASSHRTSVEDWNDIANGRDGES